MVPRLLALVVAVGMVLGAIALRGRLDDNKVTKSTTLRLVCATEMEAICQEIDARSDAKLEITVEPAGTTADRLASDKGDGDLDGWLVAGPWPQIVREARDRAGLPLLFQPDPVTLGRTRVAMVVWSDRRAALGKACGEVTWKCVGDAAARGRWEASGGSPGWGDVKPGHAVPDEASGLAVLGAAVTSFFGNTDYARIELDETPAFQPWFTGLERSVPRGVIGTGSGIERMLSAGPSVLDVVGALEVDVAPLVDQSARKNQLAVLYPAPVASADAVFGAVRGDQSERLATVVREEGPRALQAAGWATTSRGAATGLPSPGVLDLLRSRWREVTR